MMNTLPRLNPTSPTRHQAGFTLVELAVVLVIISLIAGGIMAGTDMIRSAKLRAFTAKLQDYPRAIDTFRDKYYGLPGDLPDATDYWTDGRVVDGDGNGEVRISGGEAYQLWLHLSLAGLLKGDFTGAAGPEDDDHSIVGENVPAMLDDHVGVTTWLIDGGGLVSRTNYFERVYGHFFEIGLEDSNGPGADATDRPFLTPAEMYNLDTKLDDGLPGRGKIITRPGPSRPDCTDTAPGADDVTDENDLDAVYQLSHDGEACTFIMLDVY